MLSANRATLYVIGGGGSSTIDLYDTAARAWSPLPVADRSFGQVLAATYSAEDDTLYVLDEVTVRHVRRARLLRIDPDTGQTLFVAASIADVAHFVVALDVDGTPRGFVAGLGGLTSAPLHASERGLTLVVGSIRGPRAVGYEWPSLVRGDRMIERCF